MLSPGIIDVVRHPIDTSAILYWMIRSWDEDKSQTLIIITTSGDAMALNNRLRVRLSKVRKALRLSGEGSIKRFGFHSKPIRWDSDIGKMEALCLSRFVFRRHHVADSLARLNIDENEIGDE